MVTALSLCWYCSGLRQFGIGAVVGESRTFTGGHEWLAAHGGFDHLLDDWDCINMMAKFITERPDLWNEDIGVLE